MSGYSLHAKAQSDILDIWRYTEAQWGIDQADKYLAMIRAGIEKVASNPNLAPRCDDIRSGYRRFVCGSHIIFFRQDKARLFVMRVLHQRMDFERHL